MTELSILIPVLGRPERAAKVAASAALGTIKDCDFEIVFICTSNDRPQWRAVEQLAATIPNVRQLTVSPNPVGDYAKKINHGYLHTRSPWMFTAADDLEFNEGWFRAALALFASTGCHVIGTNDLGNRRVMAGEHSTHTLVHRHYVHDFGTIDERGKVLHEGYKHTFVDDELIATAKFRGQFVSSPDSIVEHMHPDWKKSDGPPDATYRLSARSFQQGKQLFNRRCNLWEGKPWGSK